MKTGAKKSKNIGTTLKYEKRAKSPNMCTKHLISKKR